MTKNVLTVGPQTPVVEIARLMLDNDISGVPVMDPTDRLVGIVTETDLVVQNANVHFPTFLQILDARIYLSSTRKFEEEVRRALGTTAADVMTREVQTVDADADTTEAATLMVDRGVNPIPVLGPEDATGQRELVGIISRRDVIRHILNQDLGRRE